MALIWSLRALRDVEAIDRYLTGQNPTAAVETLRDLVAAVAGLRAFPHRGRPIRKDVRELTTVWPYVIRYRVQGDDVLVLRGRHGRRKPLR